MKMVLLINLAPYTTQIYHFWDLKTYDRDIRGLGNLNIAYCIRLCLMISIDYQRTMGQMMAGGRLYKLGATYPSFVFKSISFNEK